MQKGLLSQVVRGGSVAHGQAQELANGRALLLIQPAESRCIGQTLIIWHATSCTKFAVRAKKVRFLDAKKRTSSLDQQMCPYRTIVHGAQPGIRAHWYRRAMARRPTAIQGFEVNRKASRPN